MSTMIQDFARCVDPKPGDIGHYPEAAGQTFKAGYWVYLASGKVTIAATGATKLLGIALKDASGTVDTDIPVQLCRPGNRFVANVYHTTPASAITAVTQAGQKYGVNIDAGKLYVAIDDPTNLAVHVQKLVQDISQNEAVGDKWGHVEFEVLTDISDLGPGEKTA